MTLHELDLLHGYFNGNIGDAEFAQLQSLLRENAEARRVLRDLAAIDTKLQGAAITRSTSVALFTAPSSGGARVSHRPAWFGRLGWRPLAACAALALAGVLIRGMLVRHFPTHTRILARELPALIDSHSGSLFADVSTPETNTGSTDFLLPTYLNIHIP